MRRLSGAVIGTLIITGFIVPNAVAVGTTTPTTTTATTQGDNAIVKPHATITQGEQTVQAGQPLTLTLTLTNNNPTQTHPVTVFVGDNTTTGGFPTLNEASVLSVTCTKEGQITPYTDIQRASSFTVGAIQPGATATCTLEYTYYGDNTQVALSVLATHQESRTPNKKTVITEKELTYSVTPAGEHGLKLAPSTGIHFRENGVPTVEITNEGDTYMGGTLTFTYEGVEPNGSSQSWNTANSENSYTLANTGETEFSPITPKKGVLFDLGANNRIVGKDQPEGSGGVEYSTRQVKRVREGSVDTITVEAGFIPAGSSRIIPIPPHAFDDRVISDGAKAVKVTMRVDGANESTLTIPVVTPIPLPEVPGTANPEGPGNATWLVPEDTDQYLWNLRDGELRVIAKDGYVFGTAERNAISHNYGMAPDPDAENLELPLPPEPDVNDPEGPGNATWNLPQSNSRVSWTVNGEGEAIARTVHPYTFPNGVTEHNYGKPVDRSKSVEVALPPAPEYDDPVPGGAAQWRKPTDESRFTWRITPEGDAIVTAEPGFVFPGGVTEHNYGKAPDAEYGIVDVPLVLLMTNDPAGPNNATWKSVDLINRALAKNKPYVFEMRGDDLYVRVTDSTQYRMRNSNGDIVTEHNYGKAPERNTRTPIPVPPAPQTTDPEGPNNATWVKPEDTEDYMWTLTAAGDLTLHVTNPLAHEFENGESVIPYGKAPDAHGLTLITPPTVPQVKGEGEDAAWQVGGSYVVRPETPQYRWVQEWPNGFSKPSTLKAVAKDGYAFINGETTVDYGVAAEPKLASQPSPRFIDPEGPDNAYLEKPVETSEYSVAETADGDYVVTAKPGYRFADNKKTLLIKRSVPENTGPHTITEYVPQVNDPEGPNNATWVKPEDTNTTRWELTPEGELIAHAKPGHQFADGSTRKSYGFAVENHIQKLPQFNDPSVNDPEGPNNATWVKPEDTDGVRWEITDDGRIIAHAKEGYAFFDGRTLRDYGVAPDRSENVIRNVPKPEIVDGPGKDDVAWVKPEDTDRYTWEVREDGSIVAVAKPGWVFANNLTTFLFKKPKDKDAAIVFPKQPTVENGSYVKPDDTEFITWELTAEGDLIASATPGNVFPDNTTEKVWRKKDIPSGTGDGGVGDGGNNTPGGTTGDGSGDTGTNNQGGNGPTKPDTTKPDTPQSNPGDTPQSQTPGKDRDTSNIGAGEPQQPIKPNSPAKDNGSAKPKADAPAKSNTAQSANQDTKKESGQKKDSDKKQALAKTGLESGGLLAGAIAATIGSVALAARRIFNRR